jgi:hypothetical protein
MGALNGAADGNGSGHPDPNGRVSVMVRPEQLQLQLTQIDEVAIPSVVRSYEYFGHDAVVRVQPDQTDLPELVVRITGGTPLAAGARVGLRVHGAVVVWPRAENAAEAAEALRTTPS